MKRALIVIYLSLVYSITFAQPLSYGSNERAGKYLQVTDAKIYYEVYGEGRPLLLLHGDFFGYIDDFSLYIPLLSKYFKVIAVAKRGHGKSEMGQQAFSEALFAQDAIAVLQHETHDSAVVMGFSSGATTAYYLAAYYPNYIRKVVALAGGLDHYGYRPDALQNMKTQQFKEVENGARVFFANRRKLMPQPDRLGELFERLKKCWLKEVYVKKEKAESITCPVLVIGGDRDRYSEVERFIHSARLIPGSQLGIIPGCDHVGLLRKPGLFNEMILPFLIAN